MVSADGTTIPVGFGVCGDTSPSGHAVCNLTPLHGGLNHAFKRGGMVISTWPIRVAARSERTLADDSLIPTGIPELAEWWVALARTEAEAVVPKAVEYGATDLRDIGRDLAAIAGRKDVTDEEATELGIYFYLRGKLSRWTDAVIRGDRPSDDTLHDLGVYVRMAQRTRSHGGWPGINNQGAAE